VREALGRSLAECFRQGTRHATWDGVAVARGEGFRLEDISADVMIWHGEQDRNDPVAMARAQERRLPHADAVYYPDDGHLIFFSRIEEILPRLADRSLARSQVSEGDAAPPGGATREQGRTR
jgi:pimeloyl-ACP methyl ester carboxylesterase